jgi:predicted metal-dependent hydrolase
MTAMERSEIRWGTTAIPYVIRRSARRGTVSVAVEPSGRVVLTAPLATPVARLDRVVRGKARWIVERARKSSGLARLADREFVSGETVLYLGRSYRLRVVEALNPRPACLERGWLVLTTPYPLSSAERVDHVRSRLIAWYRAHAADRLTERVSYWSEQLRVQPRAVLLRDPERRWGSCDGSGTIRFSWRIIQAPPAVVDYIVIHELVHLIHRHHTPTFWALIGRVVPTYDSQRSRLRTLGPTMVW